MSKTPKIEFDKLQMYFGEPYKIQFDYMETPITILQPKLGDIISIGEKRFYATLNIFITNPTAYRLPLWEAGIDWNTISSFDLFVILYNGIDQEVADLLFDDVIFSDFALYQRQYDDDTVKPVLYNEKTKALIDEDVYNHFSQYFQSVFNMHFEEKHTSSQMMKEWFIEKDRRQLNVETQKRAKGKESSSSSLQPVISACVNHPGFKYKLSELKEVGVCEFYDSVKRLQVYENTTALLKGMYSGFVDGSKIKADDYNFMKEF